MNVSPVLAPTHPAARRRLDRRYYPIASAPVDRCQLDFPESVSPKARDEFNIGEFLSHAVGKVLTQFSCSPLTALLAPAATHLHVIVDGSRNPDNQALRVWEHDGTGAIRPVDVDALPRLQSSVPPPHSYQTVGLAELDKKLDSIEKARSNELHHLSQARPGSRAIPKDCSLHPSAFDMSYDPGDATSLDYVKQMADIGTHEGFHIVVRTEGGTNDANTVTHKLPKSLVSNVSIVPLPGRGDTWIEDHGEVTVDNTITVPACVGDATFNDDAIYRDRVTRFYPEAHIDAKLSGDELADEIDESYPRAGFPTLGAVDQRHNQQAMVALGLSARLPVRENFSYIEGGNVLPGTLPNGEGFALVGRDSIAVTRALLERDLKRSVTDREVYEAIGKDLGMKPDNIHPVEQPGTFHIDMAVGLLGPGQVILNDSREAARVQAQWLRDDYVASKPAEPPPGASLFKRWLYKSNLHRWEKREREHTERLIEALDREAESRAFFEDMTARDLKKTGLTVYRVAAVFMDPDDPSKDIANFANIRQGTNSDGQRFIIALGGPERAEQYVAKKLLGEIPCDVRRVWFLDRTLTPLTLDLEGGIKCRTKGEGAVVSAPHAA